MNKLKFQVFAVTIFLMSITQVKADKKGAIGIRLMPTVSSVKMSTNSSGTVKSEVIVGFGLGGVLGFNFSEHVSVQAEIIYNSLSQQYREPSVSHRVNLKYVNLPLLLSLNTGRYQKVNANLVLGPQIGINLGSSLTTTGSDTAQAVLAVRKGDIGFAYGAGIDVGINEKKSVRLTLGFRGVYGLFDISDHSTPTNQNSYYILDKTNIQTYSIYAGITVLF